MPSIVNIAIFLVIISILYSARTLIQNRIQAIVLLLGGSKNSSIMIYSIIMLPGVIIHELSHFFAALLTGVRTGDISLLPSFDNELEENRIALGSVKVAKTDFVRGSFIGAAPFFVGCLILFSLTLYVLSPGNQFNSLVLAIPPNWQPKIWQILVWMYASFVVGNTMFSSKEDARAFPVLIVMILIPIIALVVSGNTDLLISHVFSPVGILTSYLNASLMLVIMLNLAIAILLLVMQKIIEKLTKKKVIYN